MKFSHYHMIVMVVGPINTRQSCIFYDLTPGKS